MEFSSVEHLNQTFKTGRLRDLPEEITIAGVPLKLRGSQVHPITDMLEKNYKAFVVYAVTGKAREKLFGMGGERHSMPEYHEAKEKGLLDEWVVLIWALNPSLSVVPARVAMNTAARAAADMQTATKTLAEADQKIIHDEVDIHFKRFGKKVRAKTDTGANMSSLHVDEWRFLPGQNKVEFRSHLLSDNVLTVDCIDQVVVKTSEGTEYRPVVAFDIEVEGKAINKAQFNLNDRSHMQDAVLLGQNILEKGNFLVDPNKFKDAVQVEGEETEEIDWDALQEMYKDVEVEVIEESIFDDDKTREIYETLLKSDVSFSDLLRHIKTIAYKAIEETVNY